MCEIRRVATPTRNHSRQTCRGSQIGATASARSEVWELSWGRRRGAVPFGPSPEQQTVPGVTPVEIAYWLLKPPVAGKEKPRSCPTGARLMSDTHTRRALMLCPHGKHSTMLCRLSQFALLGNHPPVAVLLSQPCPASLFRSRWRHGAPAADLGARPRCDEGEKRLVRKLGRCFRQAKASITLYAARGRLIPFNANSPTGSTFTAFSTFVSTRGLMRICPGFASSHSREATFDTVPMAA